MWMKQDQQKKIQVKKINAVYYTLWYNFIVEVAGKGGTIRLQEAVISCIIQSMIQLNSKADR